MNFEWDESLSIGLKSICKLFNRINLLVSSMK